MPDPKESDKNGVPLTEEEKILQEAAQRKLNEFLSNGEGSSDWNIRNWGDFYDHNFDNT